MVPSIMTPPTLEIDFPHPHIFLSRVNIYHSVHETNITTTCYVAFLNNPLQSNRCDLPPTHGIPGNMY